MFEIIRRNLRVIDLVLRWYRDMNFEVNCSIIYFYILIKILFLGIMIFIGLEIIFILILKNIIFIKNFLEV